MPGVRSALLLGMCRSSRIRDLLP